MIIVRAALKLKGDIKQSQTTQRSRARCTFEWGEVFANPQNEFLGGLKGRALFRGTDE